MEIRSVVPPAIAPVVIIALLLPVFIAGDASLNQQTTSLCAKLIRPWGYPCSDHTIETDDGYLLALQRVSSRATRNTQQQVNTTGSSAPPPVLLLHGLFMGGDAWFLNSAEQSLGFILADHGFDVWVGNVRGTRWNHGHVSFSEFDQRFWDWSWEDMALHDFPKMLSYVKSITSSKVFVVGHSQGTIMALAGFTESKIVEMVQAAALLCPISYLEHVKSYLVLQMVSAHLDQMILAMNIYQLNFTSDLGKYLINSVCDGHVECDNLLIAVTGMNCCFNNSRVGLYLENEPHPSSSKNLNHLFQMIRKGSFAKYDYGVFTNLKKYGHPQPPSFDLHQIPKTLPIWMGYGGNDALADMRDVQHTLSELPTKPEVLYIDAYGHIDFLLSVTAKEDVYDHMIRFLSSHPI